jgi:TetR/AcrR family transcriptional repressor of bet genes
MSKNEAIRQKRTASPEERKRQLIEATITSISQNGITGTTLTTVTGIAGLSLGLVNFHFKTKDALLVATLVHLAAELRDRWLDAARCNDMKPHQKLATIVDVHFDNSVSNRRKLAVWFAFFGIAQGGYDHVNPDGIGEALEALFDGFWLNILMYPARFSNDAAKAHIYAYLAGQFPRHFTDAGPQ